MYHDPLERTRSNCMGLEYFSPALFKDVLCEKRESCQRYIDYRNNPRLFAAYRQCRSTVEFKFFVEVKQPNKNTQDLYYNGTWTVQDGKTTTLTLNQINK